MSLFVRVEDEELVVLVADNVLVVIACVRNFEMLVEFDFTHIQYPIDNQVLGN